MSIEPLLPVIYAKTSDEFYYALKDVCRDAAQQGFVVYTEWTLFTGKTDIIMHVNENEDVRVEALPDASKIIARAADLRISAPRASCGTVYLAKK